MFINLTALGAQHSRISVGAMIESIIKLDYLKKMFVLLSFSLTRVELLKIIFL